MGLHRLFVRYRTGATPAVFQYVNSSPSQLGNTFGTTLTTLGSPTNSSGVDRAVHFQGEIYAALHDGIWRFNQGPTNFPSGTVPGDWSKDNGDGGRTFTAPQAADAANYQTGLYPVVVGGVPHLINVIRGTGGTVLAGIKFNSETGVWSESGNVLHNAGNVLLSGDSDGGIHWAIVYRNVLHMQIGASGASNQVRMFTYDPSSDGFATITQTGSLLLTAFRGTACIYQDRLFKTASASGGDDDVVLQEYTGGVWATVVTTAVLQSGMSVAAHRSALFTDGTNMYYMGLDNTATLLFCIQFDSALADTDITGSLSLPAGMGVDARVEAFTDIDTDPLTPVIKLHISPNASAGTSRSTYLWNGPSSAVTSLDTGGDVAHAGPTDDRSGGERFFTAGQLDCALVANIARVDGEKITLVASGDPVVLLHGTVSGGPFEVGEEVEGGTSGATGIVIHAGVYSGALKLGLVVGTFQNAEVLTGADSSATATTTAGPTGGAADKKFQLFFTEDGEAPDLAEATLALPVTGGAATLNGGSNQLENLVADGLTEYTIIWDSDTDSATVGATISRYGRVFT